LTVGQQKDGRKVGSRAGEWKLAIEVAERIQPFFGLWEAGNVTPPNREKDNSHYALIVRISVLERKNGHYGH
jgi:hypothetical protein